MSTMQLSPSVSRSSSNVLSRPQRPERARQSANGSGTPQSSSSSLSESSRPSPLHSIQTREQLCEHVADTYGDQVWAFWSRRRYLNDLEIGSAWSKLLEWIWLKFDLAKIKDEQHLNSLIKRQMGYLIAIEMRSRGMRTPGGERGKTNAVASLDDSDGVMYQYLVDHSEGGRDPHEISESSERLDGQDDDTGRCRRPHRMLGSCRIDLAAAFDQLSEKRQVAVFARVIQGLTEIQTQHYFGMGRSEVQQSKHHGVIQLQKLMNGEYQTKGGRLRFVPDVKEPSGFRWEPGSRHSASDLTQSRPGNTLGEDVFRRADNICYVKFNTRTQTPPNHRLTAFHI